jgi:hypothetical protein
MKPFDLKNVLLTLILNSVNIDEYVLSNEKNHQLEKSCYMIGYGKKDSNSSTLFQKPIRIYFPKLETEEMLEILVKENLLTKGSINGLVSSYLYQYTN